MNKLEIFNKIVSILQAITVSIVSILVYCFITTPESVLSKKNTNETIAREKAKLIIEILKEPDIDRIMFSYDLIKLSYHDNADTSWFNDFDILMTHWITLKENERMILENERLINTKIALMNTLRTYGEVIGDFEVGKSTIAADQETINQLKRFISSKDNELNRFRNSSDSIRKIMNRKLIVK